jgi:hypothetical protein
MRAADALRLMSHPAAPVADGGRLVGTVRGVDLVRHPADATLEEVMEEPVALRWDDPVPGRDERVRLLAGAPIPVVGPGEELIGVLPA